MGEDSVSIASDEGPEDPLGIPYNNKEIDEEKQIIESKINS